MPDAPPPPFSHRFRRFLHPMEVASVNAARAADDRLAGLELDKLIDLLSAYSRIISQWPQPKHIPAFHEWATKSPLDVASSPATSMLTHSE